MSIPLPLRHIQPQTQVALFNLFVSLARYNLSPHKPRPGNSTVNKMGSMQQEDSLEYDFIVIGGTVAFNDLE